METTKFKELFDSSAESGSDLPETVEALRRILDGGRRWFCDVSGNGTEYLCSGAQHGVGFAEGRILVQPDGLAVVNVTSAPLHPEHERSLAKLCRAWNKQFCLEGLRVAGHHLTFETEPLDLVDGRFDADMAMGLALSTIHEFCGAVAALEAGAEPWDLLDFRESQGGGDDDDDGGGMPSSERPCSLFESGVSSHDARLETA